jgi:hypothetical protein
MAESVTIRFEGLPAWNAAVDGLIERGNLAAREVVTKGAEVVANHGKQEAPVKEGTLRRGIVRTKLEEFGPAAWLAEVGPTAVYGRRVDLGFHGTDALGRNYDQAGNPYWERAQGGSEAELADLYYDIFARALEG